MTKATEGATPGWPPYLLRRLERQLKRDALEGDLEDAGIFSYQVEVPPNTAGPNARWLIRSPKGSNLKDLTLVDAEIPGFIAGLFWGQEVSPDPEFHTEVADEFVRDWPEEES